MKQNLIAFKKHFFILFLVAAFSCKPFIAAYDQYAYVQTTSLKVDALNVMDLATEDFLTHEKEVKLVQTNLQKIYEYEKNRQQNQITVQMWQKMIDPNGHLFGGFVARWKNESKLNKAFIENEKTDIIGPAFDQIAELESKKIKPSQVSNQ